MNLMKGRDEAFHPKQSDLAFVFSFHLYDLGFSMIWGSAARCEIKNSKADENYVMSRETRVIKVLQALEMKIGNQKSLEKAKDKLLKLKDPQLFLVTSLSEQIGKERDKPGVDIAILLITALIILS